ncbi:peptide chain release factor 3 [Candidatus Pantoea edessiphila]|uniref:Peptide chain release factor 3 n=1 Tax=Candidatus Pantoea edessiphila TaxID=2044610 RepID=A0A2P5SVW9_9GAMM|nr:peptide chain release factor 3 [Candidatus Pantoea edessiphila]PPI86460.1 peptide chain release factor 3 [Candidatus Pantoea edessiphila]
MCDSCLKELLRRRTFAIISHPDAGKTTVTEKMLLFGNVINMAGTVKSRGSNKYAKSDWMSIEKERGISVTTSVLQFSYLGRLINLLDTPGHKDFSEDTYRTLTAVDSCVMIIDSSKGVEERTCKLIEVTRLRDIPIITFMNKYDCDVNNPFDLIDEIESKLGIICTPITWPIGYSKYFKGVYNLYEDLAYIYKTGKGNIIKQTNIVKGLYNSNLDNEIGKESSIQLREDIKLIRKSICEFNHEDFLNGIQSPVLFGTALGNFGIDHILNFLILWAPYPMPRTTDLRLVDSKEKQFTGFVFKIQANMDLKHRDRIAFIRIVSGIYNTGMKLYHVRIKKYIIVYNVLTFIAGSRSNIKKAYPGDIIGLHNHGSIKIGDTFTQGENINFIGIPKFAPEIFFIVRSKDPFKKKQLNIGLMQISEEGNVQLIRRIYNNDLIIGAIGQLQFEIIISRLKHEYKVEASYSYTNIATIRWLECSDNKILKSFQSECNKNIAFDNNDNLIYIVYNMVNLKIVQERYPEILFCKTHEYQI